MTPIRTNILPAIIAACVAAGCTSETPPDVPAGVSSNAITLGEKVTSLSAIEGFWLVERFQDFEPGWENGTPWREAYLQIGSEGLTYSIGCNNSFNPASLGSDGILRDTGDGSRLQTLMGCGDEREQRDSRYFRFFGTNPEVRRLGEDRLHLKSNAGELVLAKPETWRLANAPEFSEIAGRWVPRMALSYEGWGHSGFGIGERSGVVTIASRQVSWSECPEAPVAIEWTEDARLMRVAEGLRNCDASADRSDNGRQQVMEILRASPAVMRTGPNFITLIDGTGEKGRELQLQSEESVLNPPPPPPLPAGRGSPPPPPPPPPVPISSRN